MTPNALRKLCLSFPGAYEDFPFGPESSVFKVEGKLFAISALDRSPLNVSLKCEPELAEELRSGYPDTVLPGYHLNDLIVAAMPRAVRERLGWAVTS